MIIIESQRGALILSVSRQAIHPSERKPMPETHNDIICTKLDGNCSLLEARPPETTCILCGKQYFTKYKSCPECEPDKKNTGYEVVDLHDPMRHRSSPHY